MSLFASFKFSQSVIQIASQAVYLLTIFTILIQLYPLYFKLGCQCSILFPEVLERTLLSFDVMLKLFLEGFQIIDPTLACSLLCSLFVL